MASGVLFKKVQYNESPLICLCMLDNEKDGTEDVNLSKSPIITSAEDKNVASYPNISSDTGLDVENGGSIEDKTSTTQEDDQSSYLPKG